MLDFALGNILVNSLTNRWGRDFFYIMDGKRKILVVLDEGVEIPKDLSATYKFEGEYRYSVQKRTCKINANKITKYEIPEDPQEELRQLVNSWR